MARRRTAAQQVEALQAAKRRVDAALAKVQARARENERRDTGKRRAVLGEELLPIFMESGRDGEVLREILSRRVSKARHRRILSVASL